MEESCQFIAYKTYDDQFRPESIVISLEIKLERRAVTVCFMLELSA